VVGLRLRRPEPAPESRRIYGRFEDIVFDDVWIAKVKANLAAHGMTLEDWLTER
jgi:hypothetical protein